MLLAAAAAGAACRLPACVACACAQYWSPLAADGCRLHGGRLRRPRLACCSAVALAAFAGLLFCFTLRLLFAAAVALAEGTLNPARWDPRRRRGRPCQRWTQCVHEQVLKIFGSAHVFERQLQHASFEHWTRLTRDLQLP